MTELGAVIISTKMLAESLEECSSDPVLDLPLVPRIREVRNWFQTEDCKHTADASLFQDFGSITFGLSYLPTSQRLAFSIVKASNLRYERIVPNLDSFCEFFLV